MCTAPSFLSFIADIEHAYVCQNINVVHFSRILIADIFKLAEHLGTLSHRSHHPSFPISSRFTSCAEIYQATCCGQEFINFKNSKGCIRHDYTEDIKTKVPESLFLPTSLQTQPYYDCYNCEIFCHVLFLCATFMFFKEEPCDTKKEKFIEGAVLDLNFLQQIKELSDILHYDSKQEWHIPYIHNIINRPSFMSCIQNKTYKLFRQRLV